MTGGRSAFEARSARQDAQATAEVEPPPRILPVIVLSQFAGTSLWFAVNAVMPDLQAAWGLPAAAVGTLSSSVQLGFVAGTLVFALAMVADRFPPTRVFLACSLLGAVANAAMLLAAGSLPVLVALRFVVGFLLAGVYPVGMKIAAAWFRQRLGAVLGVLIGALVLGTALPHGLRALASLGAQGQVPWQAVVLAVSVLATLGGIATALLVPDRPAPAGPRITPRALGAIWSDRRLRASVFGYFGHMWELYAFIVLVPAIAATRIADTGSISALSFWAIAAGFVGCVGGGLVVRRWGSAWIAETQLGTSAACCLIAPLMLVAPLPLFVAWLLLWGATVAGDSPQFSALTGQNAPPAAVGSVLTFTNCIGFAISVVSIELFVAAAQARPLAQVLPWLALGPLAGLWMMRPLLRRGA
ncbi:MFS transporter [Ramlibacter henchirensis]|uniref:MFS transporter n=1 Tax=Ramlibacter henchirensis TaxID=204072 RepID=A0A4Z0BLW8_9BURK|nr:MFS transporter [Ramlibacter henchirensis]TFY99399.1 MFS transporter [Ramlibacter henchirensis]